MTDMKNSSPGGETPYLETDSKPSGETLTTAQPVLIGPGSMESMRNSIEPKIDYQIRQLKLRPDEYVLYLMCLAYTKDNKANRPMFPKEEKISDDPPRVRGYRNDRDSFFRALFAQYQKMDTPEYPTLTGIYFQIEKTPNDYYEWDTKFLGAFTQFI